MGSLLLKNGNLLDGKLNMKLQQGYDIFVQNGKISKIGKDLSEKADKVIDLEGAYVLPGLINMHVHLPASGKIGKKKVADLKKLVKFMCSNPINRNIGVYIGAKYAKMELYSGVTTLRAVGGVSNFDSILANAVEKNKVTGPRILAADSAIGVSGGHMDGTVAIPAATVEEAVALVEQVKKNGAHLIKLMITGGVLDCKVRGKPGDLKMSAEMVRACCDKAHELGLKVAAHVEGPEGIQIAIENGVDTIEHGASVSDELVKKFKERNGALICTLSPAMPLVKIDYHLLGYDEDAQYNSKVLLDGMIDAINKCLKQGIPVGLGTDTGCPYITHYDMWRELVYFTEYIDGVDASFAIHTATEVNAEIAGVSDITGTLETGKYADMLIVKENPLKNLKALSDPKYVIAKGKVYNRKNEKYPEIEERLNAIL